VVVVTQEESNFLRRIVVIDKDVERRVRIASHFEGLPGVALSQAGESLATAIELRNQQPDLVLTSFNDTDSWLPILSSFLEIPRIIGYTNHWNAELEAEAMRDGAVGLVADSESRSSFLAAAMQAFRRVS
jgi:hypothetical protein